MFQKGNQLGKRQGIWRATLDRAIAQDDGERLRAAAEKLLTLASKGEQWAVKELADRIDGKSAQRVELAGDAESPVQISLVDAAKLEARIRGLAAVAGATPKVERDRE